jgi:hypothetical protein
MLVPHNVQIYCFSNYPAMSIPYYDNFIVHSPGTLSPLSRLEWNYGNQVPFNVLVAYAQHHCAEESIGLGYVNSFFTVIRIHNALNNDAEIIQDTKLSSSYHHPV